MNESTGSSRDGGQNNYFVAIRRAFQCPVCIESCLPPIYQCQAGHLICSLCLPRLSSCPTCRGPLWGIRNLAMEEVANYVPFPCTHSLRGCVKLLSHTEKKEHEMKCERRPFNCPCPGTSCRWQGSLEEVMPHLLVNHQTIDMLELQQQLNKFIREKRFGECVQLAMFIHQELQKPATRLNYAICLHENGEFEECVKTLEELYQEEMKEEIGYGRWDVDMGLFSLLSLNEEVSRALVGGHLLLSHCTMDNKQKMQEMLDKRKQFEIIDSNENLDILIRLVHSHLIHPNYSLVKEFINSFIELNLDVETKKIELVDCSLSLYSFDRLSPEELTLKSVSFFRYGQELEEVKLNDFIDVTKLKRLTLRCDEDKKNLSLDFSGDVSVDYLQLNNVEVLNWSSCNWSVKELYLENIPFVEKTPIKVQEMKIYESPLDVSCLPQTLQKLNLFLLVEVFVSGGVELPNLKHLTLFMMSAVGCLNHFHSAPLTHIHLDEIEEVNVDLLPPTLTHLRITDNDGATRVVGKMRKVDNLRLDEFSLEGVEECLSHLHTDYLLIDQWDGIEAKDLLQLMKKQIQTIAVGEIKWKAEDFNDYSTQLDREAEFYLLKRGKGRAMKEEDFNGLLKKFLPDEKFSY